MSIVKHFCSYNNWILTKSNGKSVFLIEKTRGKNVMYHISSLSCVKISNGKIVLLIVAEILILFLPLYKLLSPPHHVLLPKQGQIQLPTPPLKVSSVTTSTSPYASENFNRKVAFFNITLLQTYFVFENVCFELRDDTYLFGSFCCSYMVSLSS